MYPPYSGLDATNVRHFQRSRSSAFATIPRSRNAVGIIAQERPHIVHAHDWIVHSFTPLKAWSKAKLVVTLHDASIVCAKQRLEYRKNLCSGPELIKCLR